ncbi:MULTISPECIES: hypothetical protein [unclassified Kitasatospora]|uniref:hypothetical protein n=1 Tax=unclassified Kitasatospora TaxID=2633591 RepID=UPI003801AD60
MHSRLLAHGRVRFRFLPPRTGVHDAYARLVARRALRAPNEASSATPAAFMESIILNGRIRLIDGRNLKALPAEHLTIDVPIELSRVP